MKRIVLFISIAFLCLSMLSCGGSADKKTNETSKVEVAETAKVMVYYFHAKQRCRMCIAVENVAKDAFNENFTEEDDVKFVDIDFTDRSNAALADKYEVAFSSLIITTQDEHLDLTDFAFANAISNTDLLKETFVSEVNNFLNK